MAGGGDVRIIGADNRVREGVANVTGKALHVRIVGGSLMSSCCILVDGSNALDTGAALFNVNPAVTQGDGLRVIASTGTPALGATGPGITFGAIGESVAAKRAAVVPIQGTADADQVGVGIYIHPDADGTQDLVQAAHFRYDGRVFIGNSDQGGTLNVSNDANPTGITTVAIVAYNPGIAAGNASILRAKTEPGGGDPVVQFEISGAQTYTIGGDNDSNDEFKMSASSQVQTDTFMRYIPSTGVTQFNGDGTGANFILQTSNTIAGAVANQISNTNNASGAAHALWDIRTGGAGGGDPYFRMRVGQGSGQFWSHGIDNSDDRYKFSAASALGGNVLALDPAGQVGIGVASTAAMLHVNQSNATGAIPVLELDQDDADQPFIEFDGTSAADATASISSRTGFGAVQGFTQHTVNGTKRWIPFYADPVAGGGAVSSIGEIYVENNAIDTTIAVANTPVQVTIFDTNGESNGDLTPDHTSDHVTVDADGSYLILVSATIASGAGAAAVYDAQIGLNNNASQLANCKFERQLSGGGGDVGSASISGIAPLTNGDTVELWVQNLTNTTNILFENVTMTLIKV